MNRDLNAAVIGAGPAGLMAAEALVDAGLSVTVFEAKPTPARKFLMAGKSGLNITLDGDATALLDGYGSAAPRLAPILRAFDNKGLQQWVEDLGQPTFSGSSGRIFPEAMKASPLLRAWLARLQDKGVALRRNMPCVGWKGEDLCFADGSMFHADTTVLACGGASWGRLGSDGTWARWIDVPLHPFAASNAGLQVAWSDHMQKYFGAAVKSVAWRAGDILSRGEAVVTERGLEGGGVYSLSPAVRQGAAIRVDLAPDVDIEDLRARLDAKPKKATLSQWLRKSLNFSPVKIALFHEFAERNQADLAGSIKDIVLRDAVLAPMDSAISTVGGVPFDALADTLMLHDRPGVFCAGEMIDWDAPTGGWLLTACFATGLWAGRHAAAWARAA